MTMLIVTFQGKDESKYIHTYIHNILHSDRTDRYSKRQTSYGIMLTMFNCGIIVNFDELYRCESPIRVLHHLFTTIDNFSPTVK